MHQRARLFAAKARGAAPIQWAVLNGDKITGVTIMQMADGIDTGDMLKRLLVKKLRNRLMVLAYHWSTPSEPQNDAEAIHADDP